MWALLGGEFFLLSTVGPGGPAVRDYAWLRRTVDTWPVVSVSLQSDEPVLQGAKRAGLYDPTTVGRSYE